MNEIEKNITPLFGDIHNLIEESRQKVAVTVNSEITLLYWKIGKYLKEESTPKNPSCLRGFYYALQIKSHASPGRITTILLIVPRQSRASKSVHHLPVLQEKQEQQSYRPH
ncbi:MAG: hypothetical protein KKD86_18585 [Bacteroidetes bacterium]|nr:hypothetical protein [Bacteroidota bacterium]MBU1680833.1 hypothetical protein [Bacteroidota bacterium]